MTLRESASPISQVCVPILLIVWRRPHTVRLLLDALRPLAPSRLFVACDAARPDKPAEIGLVSDTRHLIDTVIDWPCQLELLYASNNLGCSLGPIHAINWFFSQVDEGVILEDDCIPHPDFFGFCASLLQRYRTDTRIWCISGNNFQQARHRGDGSYYFSRYANCWGWATWRTRWQNFERNISNWPLVKASGQLQSLFSDPVQRRYWSLIWERTYRDPDAVTWWDYQWQYQIFTQHALSITPNVNLVRNVGFGAGASHTLADPNGYLSPPFSRLGPLVHPSALICDLEADRFLFYQTYLGGAACKHRAVLMQVKSILLNLKEQAWSLIHS